MESKVEAYIGLGANEGAPREALTAGVAALAALPGMSLTSVSRLYRTRPVGPVQQADFLNAAAALSVPAGLTPEVGAMALLMTLKELESAMGRVQRERWGSREIDLDLLLFGSHTVHVERGAEARSSDPARTGVQWLDVPHVSARERLFVLAPLADLVPDLVPPAWTVPVAKARDDAAASAARDSVVAIGVWDAVAAGWVAV
jgi:2-amino-4-hydroxy-6-hydroxymethyldihydropteridine diphosphokinase